MKIDEVVSQLREHLGSNLLYLGLHGSEVDTVDRKPEDGDLVVVVQDVSALPAKIDETLYPREMSVEGGEVSGR